MSLGNTQVLTGLDQVELACLKGLLTEWEELMDCDLTANFYQGPVWCMPWYRSFSDGFRPLVVVVREGGVLVGLVPLAVENSTGQLVFAGGSMSDYRDVVASPAHRKVVIRELLEVYRAGDYTGPLRLGYTQPESETVGIVLSLFGSSTKGYAILRRHPCYRYWFGNGASAKKLTSKESVRRHLSHYRRQGEVSLDVIETYEAWNGIKEDFYDQHSLRQLYVERPVSFNDPRKRAFYDTLLRRNPSSVHLTALRVGKKMIASHYGVLWRDVLYWGAPAFDIMEEKHSPGQIMLALLIQRAESGGLRGVDLTIGTEDFKKRFGNSYVELPTAEIYVRPREYHVRKIRDKVVAGSKFVVAKLRGAQKWEHMKKSLGDLLESGVGGDESGSPVTKLARRATRGIAEKSRKLTFVATSLDAGSCPPHLPSDQSCVVRENQLRDLLKCDGWTRDLMARISATVKKAPELLLEGYTLHTLLVDQQLAAWCWSYWSTDPMAIQAMPTAVECPPKSIWLEDVHEIPEYRERHACQTLLASVLRSRFAEGAERAQVACDEREIVLRTAIENAGFRLQAVDELVRFLNWKRSRRRNPAEREHLT